MKVSFLVANYNNGKYFGDCYQSLLLQSYEDWELIIVDDRSTDNSVEIISRLIKSDNRCRLYTLEENKGVGFVKRMLAGLAGGEVAAYMDPDDVITPDALQQVVIALESSPSIVAAFTGYSICNDQLQQCKQMQKHPPGIRPKNSFWQTGIGSINPLFGFRTEAYKLTEGINTSYRIGEDIDLYLKLEEIGDFLSIELPGYKVRRHDTSLTADRHACRYWIWIMRVLYDTGKRRVQKGIFSYQQYGKLILEQVIYYLQDCRKNGDKASFVTVRKEFFTNNFNYRLFRSVLFLKYMSRHSMEFVW